MKLGLERFNPFVGWDWSGCSKMFDTRFLEVNLIRIADNHGIRVGIENCPMFSTYNENR